MRAHTLCFVCAWAGVRAHNLELHFAEDGEPEYRNCVYNNKTCPIQMQYNNMELQGNGKLVIKPNICDVIKQNESELAIIDF